jgi:hypothetical protein
MTDRDREGPRAAPDARPLLAVAAAVSLSGAVGAVPMWAGLPHHTALPPLDLAADVRVLLAEAPSYPWFGFGVLAVLGLRATVLAAVLRALDRDGLGWAVRFYALALGPALVAGALGYAGVAALYSPFLWTGAAVSVIAVVVLGPLPWRRLGTGGWGRRRLIAYLVALLTISLVSALGGPVVQTACVWASVGLTVIVAAWPHLGTVLPHPLRGTGIAVVALIAVGVAAPAPAGWGRPAGSGAREWPAASTSARPVPAEGAAEGRPATGEGTLFLVPGIGGETGTSTMFELDPAALGFDCDRTAYFSYAGPGRGGPQRQARCPVRTGAPYRSDDTRRPIDELAASFRAQLAELTPPVVVVAHSQGAWVAAAALDRGSAPPVEALVLVGAFPGHRHGYELDGTGAGVVGTDALEALIAVLRGAGATTFDPRAPLSRQILGTPDGVRSLVRGAFPPEVRVATVTSAFDLPVMAEGWQLSGATDLCPVPVHHGHLPTSSQVHDRVRAFLAGHPESGCPWWRRWPAQALTAFGPPPP